MNFSFFKLSTLSSYLLLLTACAQHNTPQLMQSSQSLRSAEVQIDQPIVLKQQLREVGTDGAKTEDMQWLTLGAWPEVTALLSSKNKGLQILDDQQNVLHQIQGQF
ncbi:MAG: 3-phytase, partial [Acinetobacter sp.]